MSVVPKTPTVSVTKQTPDPVLPNKTAKETTVKVPLGGNNVNGGTGASAPTIPTTQTGAIDYAALAKSVGAAGVSVEDYIGLVKG